MDTGQNDKTKANVTKQIMSNPVHNNSPLKFSHLNVLKIDEIKSERSRFYRGDYVLGVTY